MSTTINSTFPTSRHTCLAARLALGAILLLATLLHFFRLDQEGFADQYYAATIKSMLTSWHNFFFAAFDPGGFVTVDKPPLGGFSGSDPILTRDELAERVAANDVRLFLISPQNNPQSALTQWVAANCARLPYFVPRSLQGAPSSPLGQDGTSRLYDCARR